MSQLDTGEQVAQGGGQDVQDAENLFDAGFELDAAADSAKPENEQPVGNEEQQKEGSAEPQSSNAAERQPNEPSVEDFLQEGQATRPAPAQQLAEFPSDLENELEELRRLNPAAAQLAMEDTPEGESIRKRLGGLGVDQAQDRAEMILAQRQRQQLEAGHAEAARQAHNKRFLETIKANNPDYFEMWTNPNRKAEMAQYVNAMREWIAAKPYSEAVGLMEIAERGRDPEKVSALISRFESERKAKAQAKPDPTGALAVPARGAPVAPSGIGDKDDFDAGWNLTT